MSVLYLSEHQQCPCYSTSNQRRKPILEVLNFKKGEQWDFFAAENKIIFGLNGVLVFNIATYPTKTLSENKILMIPSGYKFFGTWQTDGSIFIARMYTGIESYDGFATKDLINEIPENYTYDITFLPVLPHIDTFLKNLIHLMSEGLHCSAFFEIKVKELFFLLKGFYTKRDLVDFFYLHLTGDISFSDFVYSNYHKVKSVQEFAELAHYSTSGFSKYFKRIFGISPYQWMQEKRSEHIFQELRNTNRPLKDIYDEYGFASASHFNAFCKAHFNNTPAKIRELNQKN